MTAAAVAAELHALVMAHGLTVDDVALGQAIEDSTFDTTGEVILGYYRRNAQKIRDIANASRARRVEYVREYDRARGHRSYGVEKERARRALNYAVSKGDLERLPCEVCGDPRSDGHHDDYAQPLVVRWLCRTHHMELHRVFV